MTDETKDSILSIKIASAPLGKYAVRLDLSSQRTVLVGKNGAGKSLMLQGLTRGAQQTQKPATTTDAPPYFECLVGPGPGMVRFAYEYHIKFENIGTEPKFSWSEKCIDWQRQHVLWTVDHGKAVVGGANVSLQPNAGLLAIGELEALPQEARVLKTLLQKAQLVPAGIPRTRDFVYASSKFEDFPDRDYQLVYQLVAAEGTDTIREFEALVQELRLGQKVQITKFEAGKETYALVMIDGVLFSALSDGTQRLMEILWILVAFPDSLLCIEEPETAVHPALLARLLNVMDAYSSDRQIILSTHSPFLVDHVQPFELRLVERSNGNTRVRALGPEESKNVNAYLCDEGTLGEYLFEVLSSNLDSEDEGSEDRNTR